MGAKVHVLKENNPPDSERVFPDSFYLRVHTDAPAPALQVTRPLVDT